MSIEDISLEYLKDPDNWPSWPIAPVKRWRDKKMECAIVVAERRDDGKVCVVECNMFALERGALEPQLKGKREFVYDSYEAVVADGWEVD